MVTEYFGDTNSVVSLHKQTINPSKNNVTLEKSWKRLPASTNVTPFFRTNLNDLSAQRYHVDCQNISFSTYRWLHSDTASHPFLQQPWMTRARHQTAPLDTWVPLGNKYIYRWLVVHQCRWIFIRNRTSFLRFGNKSDQFSQDMIPILARRNRIKITLTRTSNPDIP